MSAPLIGTTRTDGEEEEEEGFDEAVPGAGPPVTATAAAAAVAPGAPVHHVRLMGLASFWFGASALQSALLVLVLADRYEENHHRALAARLLTLRREAACL